MQEMWFLVTHVVYVCFCGTVAIRQSFGNCMFWPIPVLQQTLIKEFANWRESTHTRRPALWSSCRVCIETDNPPELASDGTASVSSHT